MDQDIEHIHLVSPRQNTYLMCFFQQPQSIFNSLFQIILERNIGLKSKTLLQWGLI